jgi:hypothetical protein
MEKNWERGGGQLRLRHELRGEGCAGESDVW